ncbi:hypothetical protein GKC32_05630 [Lactobacillus curvatus]|nr:hypothetical protein [Latilactobacillus curvatus]MSE23947.1 hypothetical protein [Latilactobacillus curvatus]
MKTGKTLLSLTVLSLSVYRFSQTFLVQQVQRVEAVTVTMDKKAADEPIAGGEINITVKNYPKKAVTPDPDVKPDPGPNTDTGKPAINEEQPIKQEQPTDHQTGGNSIRSDQTPILKVPSADLLPSEQGAPKLEIPTSAITTDQTNRPPDETARNPIAKHAVTHQSDNNDKATAPNSKDKHCKHHAQVEKDIVAFQNNSGTPAPGGSGATTQVGVIFGELAGRSLFAVR